jgi:hypothetical protein
MEYSHIFETQELYEKLIRAEKTRVPLVFPSLSIYQEIELPYPASQMPRTKRPTQPRES